VNGESKDANFLQKQKERMRKEREGGRRLVKKEKQRQATGEDEEATTE
jgi:hypothetical protein